MAYAWLTMSSTPTAYKCWRVLIPDDVEAEACFRGALLELTRVWNWESAGGMSPEDCAQLFLDGIEPSLAMVPCDSE